MLTLLAALLLLPAEPRYLPEPRSRVSMDRGWRFALGDHPGAGDPAFDDRRWRQLDLPHDWSVEGTPREDAPGGGRAGYFPMGIGWYRKAFTLKNVNRSERMTIEFDGVYMNSEVWINGVRLGLRPFGYIGFAYDLTPHLRKGTNVVAVRVDNSRQPNSRWYSGSGIYRHVWLNVTGLVYIPRDGITIIADRIGDGRADVTVRTEVVNASKSRRTVTIRSAIPQGSGGAPKEVLTPLSLAPGDSLQVEQRLEGLALGDWSLDDPRLHLVQVEVNEPKATLDRVMTHFGVRTALFDKDRGFLLNGEQVKLRGVNLHHDAGALGAAVPEQVWESRLKKLKEMGVNAIRTSHNPMAPEFMDLCDRMGFLVMDEVFDEWTFGKVPEGYHKHFAEWAERDVVDFVRRDRNHPSVVLWSAGNEIGEQSAPDGVKVLQRLLDIFHREDPTRPVTTGNDQIVADGSPARLEFLAALDIVGYNYVDRWHERRELFAEEDRLNHPDWKLLATESGSIFQSFDESYSLGDDPARPKPNYDASMFQVERLQKWMTLRDWFAGSFMWTGIDYLGEATWPFKGFPSGALDITGEPKDLFYLYQSLWTETPGIRLFPHWNWPGREGQVIPVLAYTSCNIVELYLNGRFIGEQRKEFPAQGTAGGWNSYARPRIHPTTGDLHFRWDVPYEPGSVRAVCRTPAGNDAYRSEIRTAGPPRQIKLAAERETITTGRGDVALIRVAILDADGNPHPTANHRVCFQVTNGSILAIDNADLQDLEPYGRSCRQAFNGRMLVVARAGWTGVMQLTATAGGLASSSIAIKVEPGSSPAEIPAVAR